MKTDLDKLEKAKQLLLKAMELLAAVEEDIHEKNKHLKTKQTVAICPGCDEPFTVGPGTGRNLKRQTCSEKCKKRVLRRVAA